jgi:hypothetical protein
VANFRERLAVSKQKLYRFYMEKFCLKNLLEIEGKELYHVEIFNRFPAFENLHTEVDINGVLKIVRENIQITARESLRIL